MNFSELQQELDNRIAAAKVSGFWTSAMKKDGLIKRVKECVILDDGRFWN